MARPPLGEVRGRVWRVHAPRWAFSPLGGEGARLAGGRFNPLGMPALYLSADLVTAIDEYGQEIGIRPGTFCAYEVDVAGIADLVAPTARLQAWAPGGDFPFLTMFLKCSKSRFSGPDRGRDRVDADAPHAALWKSTSRLSPRGGKARASRAGGFRAETGLIGTSIQCGEGYGEG